MQVKLTTEQIEDLFSFTRKKWVHYYDVQLELVDHLATRIEEEMTANKDLSFEKALQKVYAGFGIFGFAKVVREKEKQVSRSNYKIYWKEVLSFFTWPKIALTAFIFLSLWQLTLWFDPILVFFVVVSAWFVAFIQLRRTIYRQLKQCQQELLLLHINSDISFWPLLSYNFIISHNNPSLQFSLAFISLITIGLLLHISSYFFHQKIIKQAQELYPEAFTPKPA